MADNTTQASEQINSAVNNALGVGALAAIYTGNFVSFGKEGGALALITKTITENGTYRAADDDADGYSVVNVNVAGVEILAGTAEPSADIGENGQIYLKTVSNGGWTCDDAYLVHDAGANLGTVRDYAIPLTKTNDGNAVGVFGRYQGYRWDLILISTEADSVLFTNHTQYYSADIDGTTWYMSAWDGSHASSYVDTTLPVFDFNQEPSQANAATIISNIMEQANVAFSEGDTYTIQSVLLKKENEWVSIIDCNIEDVNLGG